MEQVLKLDRDCDEAVNELFNCRVLQLMVRTLANKVAKVFPVSLAAVNGNNQNFLSTFHFWK